MKKYIILILISILCLCTIKSQEPPNDRPQSWLSVDSITLHSSTANDRDELTVIPYNSLRKGDSTIVQPKSKLKSLTANGEPQKRLISAPALMSSVTSLSSADVGEIAVESQTDNGIVTYTIPIEVYPGSGNLQPGVALVYSSQIGNGLAGYGWNIGGIGTISITNSNYHYDNGNVEAAKLDKYSAFTLSGMRLIKIGEDSSRITYQSEQGNLLVYNWAPSGKYYFEVKYPDGRTAIFGYKTNTTNKISYPLMRVEDNLGNYIDYTYTEQDNNYYVSEIKYGSTQIEIASIKFKYKKRTDISSGYIAGQKQVKNELLSQIETYYGKTLIFEYNLEHELKEYNLLTKVGCKANGKEKNPLSFEYGDNTSSYYDSYQNGSDVWLNTYFPNSNGKDLVVSKAKLSSDNNDAIIVYPKFDTYKVMASYPNGAVEFRSSYSPTNEILIYDLSGYSSTPKIIQVGEGFQLFTAVDINGDGIDELVKINYIWENNKGKVTVTTYDENYVSKSNSFLLEGTFEMSYRANLLASKKYLYSPFPREFVFGNFKGDGKIQLLTYYGYKAPNDDTRDNSNGVIIDLQTLSIMHNVSLPQIDTYNGETAFVGDFDGDNKGDLYTVRSNGTYVYSFDKNGNYKEIGYTWALNRNSLISSKMQMLPGDLNGDGKTDILLSPAKDRYYYEYDHYTCGHCQACIRNGGGSRPLDHEQLQPYSLLENQYEPVQIENASLNDTIQGLSKSFSPRIIGDITGDPYSCSNPITYSRQIYYSDANDWTYLISTGTAFQKEIKQLPIKNEGDISIMIADINRDDSPDLLIRSGNRVTTYLNKQGTINTEPVKTDLYVDSKAYFVSANTSRMYGDKGQFLIIKDCSITPVSYTKDIKRSHILTQSKTSHGLITVHHYANMADGYPYYNTSAISSVYPHCKMHFNQYLAIRTQKYLNDVRIESMYFKYEDAIINMQGLGFRGYRQITAKDEVRNVTTVQTYDPLKFGVLTNIESEAISGEYHYNVTTAANKVVKVLLSHKTEINKLTDVTTSTTNTYDSYGSLLTENVDCRNGNVTTTVNYYNNHTTSTLYKLGELYQSSKTITKKDKSITQKVYIPSFNQKRQPNVVVHYINDGSGNKALSTSTYYYDSQNKLYRENQTEFSGISQDTYFKYDAYGRIIETTDPLGLIATKKYNSKGLLSSSINHKGKEIKYEYNNWNEKVKTTYSDGSIETTSNQWVSSPTGALFVVTKSMTGKPLVQIYYDALGREVRQGEQRFDGKYLYTDIVYDNKGRVEKSSLPFKGASPSKWNTYTYDTYGRVTALNYASGKKDTYSYSSNSITSVIDSVSTIKKHDTDGKLLTITDPAGTIFYSYRPDGQPTSIVAPGGVKTSFEYDAFGRQTKLIDPSAGAITYAYDAAGNVSQQTLANGKITKYVYDNLKRITKKEIVGEQTISYIYNTDGLISQELSTNGTSKKYTYDEFLRLSIHKETTVDNKWLQKTYSYSDANINSIGYASNLGNINTENYIHTNGHLSEIKLMNGTSIWKLSKENDMGMTTEALSGSLTRIFDFDVYGLPTLRAVKSASNTIQNFAYDFNAQTGNLNWRKDNTRDIQENFKYDNLNRLVSFGGNTITYDNKGNITDHTGVGSFQYSASKPYAIENVTHYGNAVPMRNQQITYNGLMRPETISENGYLATLTYNGDGERVKMHIKRNNVDELIRYYMGNQYEYERGVAGTKEKLYLGGDAYSAIAVLMKEGSGEWNLHYICRDYLESITHITDEEGVLKQELSYDPWGRLRNPENQQLFAEGSEPILLLGRGYTGHEHLTMFGLINMNARLYDPVLGRFLSPDPFVQASDLSQNYNRYSYALNNPLRYTDPSGKFFFVPILVGIGVGALIGAGTAIVAYSVGCLVTGARWDINACIDAMVMGGIGGALGGGFSAIGGAFANSFGYNIISQATGNIMTDMILGNKISLSLGAVAGMVAGGLIGSALPQYNAVKGSWFKNLASEVGINTGRGAVTGYVAGMTEAIIDGKDANFVVQRMLGGAVSGASHTLATNFVFGTGQYFDDSSVFGKGGSKPVYRNGGFVGALHDLFGYTSGISWGRTSWSKEYNSKEQEKGYRHEGTHWRQQQKDGFGNFYGKTSANYARSIIKYGNLDRLYDGRYLSGNYEDIATQIGDKLRIW